MRDCKLWSLHCFGGWNTNAVLFNACDACEWKNGDDNGRHAGGSGRENGAVHGDEAVMKAPEIVHFVQLRLIENGSENGSKMGQQK